VEVGGARGERHGPGVRPLNGGRGKLAVYTFFIKKKKPTKKRCHGGEGNGGRLQIGGADLIVLMLLKPAGRGTRRKHILAPFGPTTESDPKLRSPLAG